jgi:MFS family permease
MTGRDGARRAAVAVLLAAVWAQVSVSALQQGLPALGPILQSTFSLDTASTGVLLGIGSLGTAVAVLGWGRLTDHTTDRLVAVLGLLLTAAALVVAGTGASLGSLTGTVAGLIIAGLAAAAPTVALTKSIARAFGPTRRMGLAFGIRQAAVPLGGASAGLVLPILALSIDLAAALWTLAGVLAIAALAVWRAIPPGEVTRRAAPLGPTPWRRVMPMLIASALYTTTQIGIIALLTLYLVNARGWTETGAALVFAGVMASTIVIRVIVGQAADRWPHGRITLFIATGLATATLLLLAALSSPAPVTVALLVGAGILGMGWNALAFTVTVSLVPPERIGTSQGVLNALIFTTWGLSPMITAAVVEAFSWPAAWVMLAVFALLGAGTAWFTMGSRRGSRAHGNLHDRA